jgi:hypothetical protein
MARLSISRRFTDMEREFEKVISWFSCAGANSFAINAAMIKFTTISGTERSIA